MPKFTAQERKKPRKILPVQKSSKIRSQEVEVRYPVLVSNIGLNEIQVQSKEIPDMIATFNLDEAGDFICFAHYKSFSDIGLKD